MDAATTNGLFVLGGVLLGAVPGTLAPLIDRAGSRKDKREDREHEERRERIDTYAAFLGAADRVVVLVRGRVNLGPAFRAHLTGGDDRELTPEETTAMSDARMAASRALLIAEPYTRGTIDDLVKALSYALAQPNDGYPDIAKAREPVIDAMRAELA